MVSFDVVSLIYTFTFMHLALLPYPHYVTELIGDIIIATNVVLTFYTNQNLLLLLLSSSSQNRMELCIQRGSRYQALDFHILMEIAWYMASTPYHLFVKHDRIMALHHIIVVCISSIAFYYNVTYLTFIILSSIIWSNIFLGISKATLRLLKQRNCYYHRLLTNAAFTCFAISFFVFRIVFLPFYITPLILFDIRKYWVYERGVGTLYWLVVSCFLTIIAMQFLWMWRIIVKLLDIWTGTNGITVVTGGRKNH